jgi:hypothetical protein
LIFARQMSRRPERALPLGVRSAQNKQFMMRQREKFCKLISQRADGECGMKNALSGERDSIRKAETRREKRGGEGVRARGDYFRRDRFEISSETDRNTSTASAPIMQKAIIIFSDSAELRDGIGKPHARRACELSLVFAIRDGLARCPSCR